MLFHPAKVLLKVFSILFESHSACCVLFQTSKTVPVGKTFLIFFFFFQTVNCHSKGTSDFDFQAGSSSLFCTVGHSADGKNVALWDTLMPQRRSLVERLVEYNVKLFYFSPGSSLGFLQDWCKIFWGPH